MPDSAENPRIHEEQENLKYGLLTFGLGFVAALGSLKIPERSLDLRELQFSLGVGGLIIAVKGVFETLNASDQLDKLRKDT